MPKRAVEFFVIDILLSIDRIKRYTKSVKTVDQFTKNEMLFDATLHELQIVGEAMSHVLKSKRLNRLIKPLWREIVNFRNVVHEYFGLSYDEVFKIIKKEIPLFEKEFLSFSKNLAEEKPIFVAIADTKTELKALHRLESLKYLNKIEKFLKKP